MTTSAHVVLLVLIKMALYQSAQTSPYNCNRIGSDCYSPSDVCNEGTCDCMTPDMAGYDCSLDTTMVDVSNKCDPPCGNGTCLNDNTCYCTPGVLSDRCEKQRVSLQCYPDRMELTVAPNVGTGNTFAGLVHVSGAATPGDETNCIGLALPGQGYIKLTVPYTHCGQAIKSTTDEGDTRFSFQLAVLFSPPVFLSTDLMFDSSCVLIQGDRYLTFTSEIIRFSHRSEFGESKKLEKKINPISLTVLEKYTEHELDGTTEVGRPLVLDYRLINLDVYDNFLLHKVFAYGGNGERVTIIEEGCRMRDNFIVEKLVTDDTSTRAYFSAFKFIGSNMVTFTSMVKLCENPGQCKPADCDEKLSNITDASSRRRRDASDSTDDVTITYKEVDTTIFVTFPSEITGQNVPLLSQTRECPNIMLLRVLCGLLAGLLLLSTGCGLLFFVRMRMGITDKNRNLTGRKLPKTQDYS